MPLVLQNSAIISSLNFGAPSVPCLLPIDPTLFNEMFDLNLRLATGMVSMSLYPTASRLVNCNTCRNVGLVCSLAVYLYQKVPSAYLSYQIKSKYIHVVQIYLLFL